jgi:hypothetical protein
MSPRRLLLGVMGVIGLTGLAAGEPPVNPFVEGRESNPVAREFHQADSSPGGYVAPDETTGEAAAGLPIPANIWLTVLDQLTFPLGTAPMLSKSEATGA